MAPEGLRTPLLTSRRKRSWPGSTREKTTHGPPRQPRGRRLPSRGSGLARGQPVGGLRRGPGAGPGRVAARGPRPPPRVGAPARTRGMDLCGLARRVRRPRRLDVPAGDLERGVRPGRRPGPRQRDGRGPAGPDLDRLRHRRAEASASSTPSGGGPNCGARATPSPTPARTSPTSRPRRSSTATTGSSRARRSGPPTPSGATGASSCAAPIPTRRVTRASPISSCPWTRTASRSAPSAS